MVTIGFTSIISRFRLLASKVLVIVDRYIGIEIKNKIIIKISNYETEKITYLGIGIGRPRR
jgi:hypothetical protein